VGYLSYTLITAILSILADETANFPFDIIFVLYDLGFSSIIIGLACLNNNKNKSDEDNSYSFTIFITLSLLNVVLLELGWKKWISVRRMELLLFGLFNHLPSI
jgi:hypothetical protein